jgi:hypothetical protein
VQNVGQGAVNLDSTGETIVYLNGALQPTGALADGVLEEGETIPLTIDLGTPLPSNQDVKIKVAGLQGTAIQATVYPDSTSGGGGGGTTPTPPPTVTRASTSASGFSSPTAGDLLVVIANTRTGYFDEIATDALTASASGYTMQGMASYMDDTGDRRAVVLLTKIATGSESGAVSITWDNGPDTGSNPTTYATFYQVFSGATTYTKVSSSTAHNGGGSGGTSLSISGLPTSTSANVLTIGAGVWRDNPGTVSFTNLAGQYGDDYNNCYSESEYNYGDAVTGTDITWTTTRLGSGLLIQFECE